MATQYKDYDCSKETVEGEFANGDKFSLQTYHSYTAMDDHITNAVSVLQFADVAVGEAYEIHSWNSGIIQVSPAGHLFLVNGDQYTLKKDAAEYKVDNLSGHVVRITDVAAPAAEEQPPKESETAEKSA